MLRKTAMPATVSNVDSSPSDSPELRVVKPTLSWSDPSNLPGPRVYRRPDLRHLRQILEKMLTFQVEVNLLDEIPQTMTVGLPTISEGMPEKTLTLELRRGKALIKGILRLRAKPTQLQLSLPESPQMSIPFPEEM